MEQQRVFIQAKIFGDRNTKTISICIIRGRTLEQVTMDYENDTPVPRLIVIENSHGVRDPLCDQ